MSEQEAKGKRLYVVSEVTADQVLQEKIVEAATQAQAIKLVVGERFTAKPASAYDVQRILQEAK